MQDVRFVFGQFMIVFQHHFLEGEVQLVPAAETVFAGFVQDKPNIFFEYLGDSLHIIPKEFLVLVAVFFGQLFYLLQGRFDGGVLFRIAVQRVQHLLCFGYILWCRSARALDQSLVVGIQALLQQRVAFTGRHHVFQHTRWCLAAVGLYGCPGHVLEFTDGSFERFAFGDTG